MASEQRVGPSTEERPDDADDNVTNTALPRVSAGEDTGDPTRQRSEDDPRNPAQVRDNIHLCLLLRSCLLFLICLAYSSVSNRHSSLSLGFIFALGPVGLVSRPVGSLATPE